MDTRKKMDGDEGNFGGEDAGKNRNVNCFRRCKRYFRKKIKWNTWHMRYQMRVHLFSLFIMFLMIYAIFMIFYSYNIYQSAVVNNLKPEWPRILDNRLTFSTESISTALYMIDKIFIDSAVRMSMVFKLAMRDPFPIKANAFDLYDASDLESGMRVYNGGAHCVNI